MTDTQEIIKKVINEGKSQQIQFENNFYEIYYYNLMIDDR